MTVSRVNRLQRLLMAPSVFLLLVWMIIPLSMTLYFSVHFYTLIGTQNITFAGFENYLYFVTDPSFLNSLKNTIVLTFSVLAITITVGTFVAVLIDNHFPGRGLVRVLLISPFFIMPTVNALVWKNLLMHPVNGFFAWLATLIGMDPIDWLGQFPLLSVIIIVSWQWTPFAILILMTALQSMDQEQIEAAKMDGAGSLAVFRFLTVPHLMRPIFIVMMIETIFLLSIFAEILVTTAGGPGDQSTNLVFLIYTQALLQFDIGTASAGGIVAIILANLLTFILVAIVGKALIDS